jgi:hypothetical protein
MHRRSGFVGGRGSRLGAGGTPRAGVAAPAASGSRSWCHRRGGTARRWRPARGRWPGRRRAAPRTAPAAPRSAGPSPGRASPHRTRISNVGSRPSRVLLLRQWRCTACGRGGPRTGGTCGQQGTARETNLEVSGLSPRCTWTRNGWSTLSRASGHSRLVQIAVRRDPAPMDEAGATTTSASISELRGFTAIAQYYPVGGVS